MPEIGKVPPDHLKPKIAESILALLLAVDDLTHDVRQLPVGLADRRLVAPELVHPSDQP
jgi:hypothetical protein